HRRHGGAAEEAEAEPVGVLVGDGADDGLGRLPQPGVDDLQAGVAQGAGHHLDAAVVAVEADLGEDDAERGGGRGHALTSLLLEEAADRDAEVAEDVGQGELVVLLQDLRRTVRVVDVRGLRAGVEHANGRYAGAEVFADLYHDFAPAVLGRADFPNRVRRDGQVALRQRAFGYAVAT